MRYLIAASLILFAVPAAAQRVDTQRIDTSGSGTSCTLRAAPDLHISHNGERAIHALWFQQATGSNASDGARLYVSFRPETAAPRTTPFGVTVNTNFYIDTPQLQWTKSVRVEVDGRDIGVAPVYDPPIEPDQDNEAQLVVLTPSVRPRLWIPSTWTFPAKDYAAAARRIMRGKRLELILLDQDGKELDRFRWDTSSLRDIPAILDRIDWSCTGPIRK
jgi:hypothetical protein